MRLGLFTLSIALLLGALNVSAGESPALQSDTTPETISTSLSISTPTLLSVPPTDDMTIVCTPTRSAPWQVTEAYNNSMMTAVAQHNEAISQAYADMEAENAEALDMFHTRIQGKQGDDVADELNQALVEYNQALESSNMRYTERISQIRAIYDAAVSQATIAYESVICPRR